METTISGFKVSEALIQGRHMGKIPSCQPLITTGIITQGKLIVVSLLATSLITQWHIQWESNGTGIFDLIQSINDTDDCLAQFQCH